MFVICKNDYPWSVCPENTTEDQALHIAKVKQREFNADFPANCTRVYMHVQNVPLLTTDEVKSF